MGPALIPAATAKVTTLFKQAQAGFWLCEEYGAGDVGHASLYEQEKLEYLCFDMV